MQLVEVVEEVKVDDIACDNRMQWMCGHLGTTDIQVTRNSTYWIVWASEMC